jgi:HAD superfamily hydrolase (TIGR01509 family)
MIEMTGIKGIIFDFDGTLVDSLGMWKDLDSIYLMEKGFPAPEDLRRAIEGLSFNETASYFKKRFSLKESVEKIVDDWHEHIETVYPFLPFKEGAQNFVRRLEEKGYKLALATSNSRRLVSMVLEEQNFENVFPIIVTSDDVGRGKPCPDVFLETAKRMELSPANCLVFEDTYNGVLGAKRAGMKTLAIFDFHNKERWEDILEIADYTAEHYEDIEGMIL